MLTKFQIFKLGFFDVAPHLLSVVPFGIIFGAIGIELGFDPIMTYATSLIIFGGASQIVFLQLLSGGASSLIAITSVGVINSRHLKIYRLYKRWKVRRILKSFKGKQLNA